MGHRGGAFGVLATLVLVGLLAAGCSSSKKTTTGTGRGRGRCPSGITIGFFGALTGKSFPEIGIGQANATQLAIEQYNSTNPGCHVSFKAFDSQGDAAQAPGLAQQAVSDKNVVALIGPAYSGESQVADPIFNEADLPIITVSATFPQLSQYGWKIFHRAVANNDAQAPAIARYIFGTLKAGKVAVIDDGSDYGKGLADVVRQKVTALGVTVVNPGSIDNSHHYPATVRAVKIADVDAVFYGGYFWEAGPLAKQLTDGGVTATFMSDDGSLDAGFVTRATPSGAEGAVLTAPTAYVLSSPNAQSFVDAYKGRFNTLPVVYTAEAYDAANHLLAAIAAGKYTRAEINRHISTTPYRGMLKTYDYGTDGELKGTPVIFVHKVVNGQIKLLGPA